MKMKPDILFLLFLLPLLCVSQNPSSSQTRTLFRLRRILKFPAPMAGWNRHTTNLCYLPNSTTLNISCSPHGDITQILIVGNYTTSRTLSPSFSVDSLFTTLSSFGPTLTHLSLVSLGIWGPLSPKIKRLASLNTLNLSSNHFYGPIPTQIASISTLDTLDLSYNSYNGTLPFRSSEKLVTLVLKNNSFHGSIPSFLFSLPSLRYLDLSGNRFSGSLPADLSCGGDLRYVDVSTNLLVGDLPKCVASDSSTRTTAILSSWNCFSSGTDSRYQHPNSYCDTNKPLAAILPVDRVGGRNGSKPKSLLGLIFGIVGGIIGGVVLSGLFVFFVIKRAKSQDGGRGAIKLPKPLLATATAVAAGKASVLVSPRTPTDTRHMSQAVRIGMLGLTPYRVFTMEEVEEATNNFDPSNCISQGPQGQLYKGWLPDGSTCVLRCLKLKQKYTPQSLIQYMDVISKLRHLNLVSILGHCITTCHDNASTNNIVFLVFEYVPNGTLRSHLTEWRKREMLKWPQRVSAVIGVARGIQFLHTVTVPGIVGNDLRIENIMLDQTLTAKISNYNLPMLPKKNSKIGAESPFDMVEQDGDLRSIKSLEHGEKEDVYQLGLILVEIITGKPAGSQRELDALKLELQESVADGPTKLCGITDPTIRGTFAFDSLQTLVAVTLNCLAKDQRERPSIDDILWNLQYSVQVQDGWTSSDSLSIH